MLNNRRNSPNYGLMLVIFAGTVATSFAQTPSATDPYTPISTSSKAAIFAYRTIEPAALGKSLVTAGFNHWQNSPEEWGQGMAGYGRRYGHKLATRGVESGFGFVVAAALHEDPRYFRLSEGGLWRRVGHALKNTIATRKDDGSSSIALWRISAKVGGQFVSNAWRPDRYHPTDATLGRAAVSVGYDGLSNIFKEFWPDIRRKVFRR